MNLLGKGWIDSVRDRLSWLGLVSGFILLVHTDIPVHVLCPRCFVQTMSYQILPVFIDSDFKEWHYLNESFRNSVTVHLFRTGT